MSLHVFSYTTFSPLDEFQHYDYVYKVAHGELVRPGDRISQEVMREEACRGVDYPVILPPCDFSGPFDPNVFPESAFNTADIHPPTYYFLTGMIARALLLVPGIDNLMDAARLAGALWLGIALVVIWRICNEFEVPVVRRVVIVALVATSGPILHASATVNPDATALLAGGLVVLATLGWERGRLGLVAPVLAAAFAVSLKSTNVLAVVGSVIYMGVRARPQLANSSQAEKQRSGYLRAAAAILGVTLLVAVMWLVSRSLLAPGGYQNPQIDRFRVSSLSLAQILSQSLALLTPLGRLELPAPLHHEAIRVTAGLVNALFLAALGGCLVGASRIGRLEALAIAVTFVMLIGSTGLVLANYYLNSGIFVGIPGRYGLSLLPLLGLVLADVLRQKTLLWATSVLAAVSLIIVLFLIVTHG